MLYKEVKVVSLVLTRNNILIDDEEEKIKI
jgi:hypothetical protein